MEMVRGTDIKLPAINHFHFGDKTPDNTGFNKFGKAKTGQSAKSIEIRTDRIHIRQPRKVPGPGQSHICIDYYSVHSKIKINLRWAKPENERGSKC